VLSADDPEWISDARRALGARIRTRRLHKNLTQEALAERSGLDRSTVQRIEGALNDPRHSHLIRIANALDTTLADLVR
jgi:transcriptional regulator with XRE-family HTH domain